MTQDETKAALIPAYACALEALSTFEHLSTPEKRQAYADKFLTEVFKNKGSNYLATNATFKATVKATLGPDACKSAKAFHSSYEA